MPHNAFLLSQFCHVVRKAIQQSKMESHIKLDATPVSQTDYDIETAIRDLIKIHYPNDNIVGEELPPTNNNSNTTFIIDPIDGTKAFLCGKPTFMTLLGITNDGTATFGIAYQPTLDYLWWGDNNSTQSLKNNALTTCKTSKVDKIINARLSTTSSDLFGEQNKVIFQKISDHINNNRKNGAGNGFISMGGDAYQYALLASGSIDIVIEDELKIVDIMPLIPIIKGAGGMITTWDKQEITEKHFDGTVIATANKKLHDECVNFIKDI